MENIQSRVNNLHQELVKSLCSIKEIPDDFLPHTVFVEEEGNDATGPGVPVYNKYELIRFSPGGKCLLRNPTTLEETEMHLSDINIDWLVTLWMWYEELIYPEKPDLIPEKRLSAFLYPAGRFERNAVNEEIIADYEMDGEQTPCVEKYTPDEFAAMLNDGGRLQDMYVRFIEY